MPLNAEECCGAVPSRSPACSRCGARTHTHLAQPQAAAAPGTPAQPSTGRPVALPTPLPAPGPAATGAGPEYSLRSPSLRTLFLGTSPTRLFPWAWPLSHGRPYGRGGCWKYRSRAAGEMFAQVGWVVLPWAEGSRGELRA